MDDDTTPYNKELVRYRLDHFARTKWQEVAKYSPTARVIYERANIPEEWQQYSDRATVDETRAIITSSRELAGIMCALVPHTTQEQRISLDAVAIYTEPLTPQGRPIGGCRWVGNSVLRIVRDLDKQ